MLKDFFASFPWWVWTLLAWLWFCIWLIPWAIMRSTKQNGRTPEQKKVWATRPEPTKKAKFQRENRVMFDAGLKEMREKEKPVTVEDVKDIIDLKGDGE